MVACQQPKVPSQYAESQRPVAIFPDYRDVTVPVNIAPLTFNIDEEGTNFVTRFTAGGREWLLAGREVCPSPKQWRQMLSAMSPNGR